MLARRLALNTAVGVLLTACGSAELQGLGRRSESAETGSAGPSQGGAGNAPSCSIPLAERVRTTVLDVSDAAVASDEYTPTVAAPAEDGGTLVAWRAAAANEIRVTRLDAEDAVVGSTPPFTGREVHAIVAHEDGGGALAIVDDDPEIYDDRYCTPDLTQYCAKLDLLRFDAEGSTIFRTPLTDSVGVGTSGALFIYWYQHTARVVFAEDTYAVYFRSAGSTEAPDDPTRVDIHAGDTFRFVDAAGQRIAGGWAWGCSHSWSVRLAYDGFWGAACHGDGFPNGMRLTVLDPEGVRGEAIFSEGVDPTRRALGGLVPDTGAFWLAHVVPDDGDELTLRLARITDDGTLERDALVQGPTGLDDVYPFRIYLAAYGAERFLLGYKSGGELQLAVIDEEGTVLEGPVTVDAPIDDFSEMVATPGGDVIWAHSRGGAGGMTLTRVRGC
jgi:hypothetical protein